MMIGGRRIAGVVLTAILINGPAWGQGKIDPFKPDGPRAGKEQPGVISSVELVDTPITNVFKMISDLTGWSIFMSPEVSEKPPKINIWIKNLTPDQVLERVSVIADLVVERKGNAVEVMSFDEYARTRGVAKRIIQLKNARAKDVAAVLQPFVQKEKDKSSVGKVLPGEESNKLVLLLPEPLLESLVRVVEALDVPFEKDTVRVIPLKHTEASILGPKLERFLVETSGRGMRSSRPGEGASPGAGGVAVTADRAEPTRAGERWVVQFMVEPRLNVIVLRGLAPDVKQTEDLIARLDQEPGIEVASYTLKYTNAREVYRTLQEIIKEDLRVTSGGQAERDVPRLRVSSSEQNNQIIVEGSGSDQARLSRIIAAIDKPLSPSSGGIRVYRLENSTAKEVADVLQGVIENKSRGDRLAAQERRSGETQRGGFSVVGDRSASADRSGVPAPSRNGSSGRGSESSGGTAEGSGQPIAADVIPAQVTAAPDINAVVIKASAAEHEEFAVLIRQLDKPRDQVMLEVTLVTVRSSENFNLGVELSGAHLNGGEGNRIGFSTFGVGKVDPATGNLGFATPPAFGLNFGLFKTDEFSIVFNALKTVGDTRISATPKILVEDNAPAEIKQLSKEPYTTVSQGQSSTLTSFGGFAEAGATFTVIPHISKDEWLRLEYQVNLSSFDKRTPQQLAANLPPPIRQNTSQGTVRIPADHTVVLGGLASTRDEQVKDGIPLLCDIPIIGSLFENRSTGQSRETLFIFIRPVVLRDLAFRDLQYLSREDVQKAKLASRDYPDNALRLFVPNTNDQQKKEN